MKTAFGTSAKHPCLLVISCARFITDTTGSHSFRDVHLFPIDVRPIYPVVVIVGQLLKSFTWSPNEREYRRIVELRVSDVRSKQFSTVRMSLWHRRKLWESGVDRLRRHSSLVSFCYISSPWEMPILLSSNHRVDAGARRLFAIDRGMIVVKP